MACIAQRHAWTRFIGERVFPRVAAKPPELTELKRTLEQTFIEQEALHPKSKLQEPTPEARAAIRDLVRLMTLEEKVNQLGSHGPGIPAGPCLAQGRPDFQSLVAAGLGSSAHRGAVRSNTAQRMALRTRLGIPLLNAEARSASR